MPISRKVRITRTAISPRLATSTVSNMSWPLHPEDAVADVFHGGVCAGGQRQAEDGAGLGGVDHAVVPEPGGGVVRVALRLVLVADGLLERLFVLGRPLLAAGLEAVAADGREHAGGLLPTHHRDAGVGPGEQEPRRGSPAAHRGGAR